HGSCHCGRDPIMNGLGSPAKGIAMFKIGLAAFGLLTTAVFVGCGESPRSAIEDRSAADAAGTESEISLTDEELDSLAERQKVCAVTGEPLGSMGKPVPVRVSDSQGEQHTVLLCCESCREELLSNPDKYLAQLNEQQAEEPGT